MKTNSPLPWQHESRRGITAPHWRSNTVPPARSTRLCKIDTEGTASSYRTPSIFSSVDWATGVYSGTACEPCAVRLAIIMCFREGMPNPEDRASLTAGAAPAMLPSSSPRRREDRRGPALGSGGTRGRTGASARTNMISPGKKSNFLSYLIFSFSFRKRLARRCESMQQLLYMEAIAVCTAS